MPFVTEVVIFVSGIPKHSPAIMETTRKARKGFIFPHVINSIRNKMARTMMRKVIIGQVVLVIIKR
jgi:hypothetical protein